MNLDVDDLRRLADFLDGLATLTKDTGISVSDMTYLWDDGEILGGVRMNGTKYELEPSK